MEILFRVAFKKASSARSTGLASVPAFPARGSPCRFAARPARVGTGPLQAMPLQESIEGGLVDRLTHLGLEGLLESADSPEPLHIEELNMIPKESSFLLEAQILVPPSSAIALAIDGPETVLGELSPDAPNGGNMQLQGLSDGSSREIQHAGEPDALEAAENLRCPVRQDDLFKFLPSLCGIGLGLAHDCLRHQHALHLLLNATTTLFLSMDVTRIIFI